MCISGRFDTVDATWGGKPLEFPRIQGADVAGHIAAAGEGVSNSRIGERVITDGWLRDAKDPLNPEKATYLGSERDGGDAIALASRLRVKLGVDE